MVRQYFPWRRCAPSSRDFSSLLAGWRSDWTPAALMDVNPFTPVQPHPRPRAEEQSAKRRCLAPVRRTLLHSLVPDTPSALNAAPCRTPENHNEGRAAYSQRPTHLDWCARSRHRTTAHASVRTRCTPLALSTHEIDRDTSTSSCVSVCCVYPRSSSAHGRVARGLAARRLELQRRAAFDVS